MAGSWEGTLGSKNAVGLTLVSRNDKQLDKGTKVEGGTFASYCFSEVEDIWLDDDKNIHYETKYAYAFTFKNLKDGDREFVISTLLGSQTIVGGRTGLLAKPQTFKISTVCQEKVNSMLLDEKPQGTYYTYMVNGVKKYSLYTMDHFEWVAKKGGLTLNITAA